MAAKKKRLSDSAFIAAVKNNRSAAGVLRAIGLDPCGGGNYNTVRDLIKHLNLDTSHWTGKGHLRGKSNPNAQKRPMDYYLRENSKVTNRSSLKDRLIKEGLLKNECAVCQIEPRWNNKPLVLVLDHKNGINNDYRLSNIRLLCPNCNSQTDTFTGKNCLHRKRPKDDHALSNEIIKHGFSWISKKYGVNRNKAREWARKLNCWPRDGNQQTSLSQKERFVGANPTEATNGLVAEQQTRSP